MSNNLSEQQAWKMALEKFQAFLNRQPNKDEVRVNQHAGNTLYLPISYVEMSLDELFFGLWETKSFEWKVVGNEIAGTITLRVFHPVEKIWIERIGASATMIRQQKGAGITEVEKKIHNALEMDFPHLKADCVVNAAKSLGTSLGRDLNRKFTDIYRPIVTAAAVQNGAVTAQVDANNALAKEIDRANELLEVARMDDQTERSFLVAIQNCELPDQVRRIIDDVKQYIPESQDPARQFKNRKP